MVIAAIALNIGSILIRVAAPSAGGVVIAGLCGLAAICLAVIGVLRLTGGLQYPMAGRVLCCLLMIVPLLSLIVLAIINREGTKVLRGHGFAVKLFGADQQPPGRPTQS
ncbi:MAG: hypothetical protein ABI222_17055 [Opitutaceae bacterium]